ncbi:MAG: HIT domain-containing protein [Myxococcota bacterium]
MDFFAQVTSGRLPVTTLVVTNRVIAFLHPEPFFEEHVVVIPRKSIPSLTRAAKSDESILVAVLGVVARVARDVEERWGGCHIETRCGTYQTEPHLHFTVTAGERLRTPDGAPIQR